MIDRQQYTPGLANRLTGTSASTCSTASWDEAMKFEATKPHPTMGQEESAVKIKVTSIYVNDQKNALRFYTEVLGFVKKADFTQGPFRRLTVASPEEPDSTELQ